MSAIASRLAASFDAERLRPDLGRATRSTTALLLALGLTLFGHTGLEASFLAVSAHTLGNVDIRGPYGQRIAFLTAMALVMTGTAAMGAAANGSLGLTLAATVALALNAAVWRHLTPEYGPSVAVPTGLCFFMALFAPHGPLGPAVAHHAASVLAGASIGLIVHAALWPVRAQHPLRRGVAEAWSAAATLFEAARSARADDTASLDALAAAESALRGALDGAAGTLARANVAARRRRRRAG